MTTVLLSSYMHQHDAESPDYDTSVVEIVMMMMKIETTVLLSSTPESPDYDTSGDSDDDDEDRATPVTRRGVCVQTCAGGIFYFIIRCEKLFQQEKSN